MAKYLLAAGVIAVLTVTSAAWYFGLLPKSKYWGGCEGEQISLNVDDEIICKVWVKKTDRYAVNIKYTFDPTTLDDIWRVKRIVEGLVRENGSFKHVDKAPVKIQTTITSLDGPNPRELISKASLPEKKSQGAEGISAEALRIELQPGNYEIRVKNLTSIPELATVKTSICFVPAYEGK
jgi:hypothetical protein